MKTKLYNGDVVKKGDCVIWTDSDGMDRIDFVGKYRGKLFICNNNFPITTYKNARKIKLKE